MNPAIPAHVKSRVQMVRMLGQQHLRPMGLEADKTGQPTSPDHPFYKQWAAMGLQGRGVGERNKDDEAEGQTGRESWSARSACLIAEEAAYWDRGAAVTLPGPGLGGPPVMVMGTPQQKQEFLGIFANKTRPLWGAFAMTEPGAGSDVANIATRCEKRGDRWVLNGEKAFCSNSDRAEWVVVWATVDKKLGRAGHRAFVVPKGTPGFSIAKHEAKMGLKAYASCALTLENVEVPETHLLGGLAYYEGKQGFKGAMKSFDASRPVIAIMAAGIARAAWDEARRFAKAHYNFARPLPRYRKLQEKFVDVQRKIRMGQLLCMRAAWLADHQKTNTLEASIAKAYTPMAAQAAISLCLELLGDAGIDNDLLIEKLYRDVKAMDIVEGTGQIQRRVVARRLLDYPYE